MDMQNVIYAVAVLFIMGIVFAILLGVAAKVFAVEVDERIPLVRECLPGANCGGCGFPGCDGLAAAIVEGRAPVNGCPVGGAAAAEKIAKVLGAAKTNISNGYSFIGSLVYGVAAGVGYTLAIVLFASIRERLDATSKCPKCFEGFPISLVAAALLAMSFMGFSGLSIW